MKKTINDVLVVEGTGDASYISTFVEALIIATNGYEIPEEELDFLRHLPKGKKAIILTDSDEAGYKIRKYNNLNVSDKEFGVQLTFDGRPFFIRVPFSALVEFKDPSVDFMLSFQKRPETPAADNDIELPLDGTGDTVPDTGRIVSLDEFRKRKQQ